MILSGCLKAGVNYFDTCSDLPSFSIFPHNHLQHPRLDYCYRSDTIVDMKKAKKTYSGDEVKRYLGSLKEHFDGSIQLLAEQMMNMRAMRESCFFIV